ncbi:Cullin-associated NEDD8-dissociated protein 1 [Castilleja foliolosa]|uniref:Cullin-associated NEDD8-dissociated protein 1 n=1 Tax=Castilleja foliolosa TaxID=1961234 RepID=A0ABD3E572_9LAMI
MANLTLTGILEKMTGKDKDYKYMASSDSLNELNKDGFKLGPDLETKLSNIIIQQLDDAAGDVSGLALMCSLANAEQSKVPAYLGAMSPIACFMAAIVSIVLAFSIVPRQVMSWTGLLLVYEWAFPIFFLLFGVYLHVIGQWGNHVAHHQSSSFSSSTEPSDYDSGKGHLRQ